MALYEKLEYELEFITPAFIGGAFPEEQAELRPSSFIGILRWWFRNLALTVTEDLKAIANLERELFGNTEQAGKVWVKIEPIEGQVEVSPKDIKKKLLGTIYFLPHKDGRKNIFNPYLYLGYGNILNISFCKKNRQTRKFELNWKNINEYFYILKKEKCLRPHIQKPEDIRSCSDIKRICQKGNFLSKDFLISRGKASYRITLLVPKQFSNLVKPLMQIISQLGSTGGRNRRGWGSFYLYSEKEKILPYWNEEELTIAYNTFYENLKNVLLKHKVGTFIPFQETRLFLKNYGFSNNLKVLEQLGLDYKNFRNRLGLPGDSRGLDYQEAKNFLEPSFAYESEIDDFLEDIDCIKYNRIWFGLPIGVRYSDPKVKAAGSINLFESGNLKSQLRLASPVIFRVVRFEDGNYGVAFIVLKRNKFIENLNTCGNYETWVFTNKANKSIIPYITRKEKVKNKERKKIEITIGKEVVASKSFDDFIIKTFLKKYLEAEEFSSWGKENDL